MNDKIAAGLKATYAGEADFDSLVNEVAVMARTCAFKIRSNHSPDGQAKYVAVDCANELHIPLQRLLQTVMSIYYDPSRGGGRG